FAVALAEPAAVRADDATVLAEESFRQGKALMAANRIDEACPKFEESFKIKTTSGAMINLAACHEQQSKTASAWSEFKEAARLARRNNETERAAVADERAAALEPTLSRLQIDAANRVPGFQVQRDGIDVGVALLGFPIAADPGPHKVVASAPGY